MNNQAPSAHYFSKSAYSHSYVVPCLSRQIALTYLRNEVVACWPSFPAQLRVELRALLEKVDDEGLHGRMAKAFFTKEVLVKLSVLDTYLRRKDPERIALPPVDEAERAALGDGASRRVA